MPTTYGNPNKRAKHDAFRIVEESGYVPLKEAIACARRLRSSAEILEKGIEYAEKPETKAQLTLALAKCIPDEFHAWIKIAEFIHAKPKAPVELTGHVTLEQLLEKSWDETPKDLLEGPQG